jgi:hypothetical protein
VIRHDGEHHDDDDDDDDDARCAVVSVPLRRGHQGEFHA